MSDIPRDRRRPEQEPLRDAFDELVASLAAREGDAMARMALRACAERARHNGIPPERFIAALKRILARHPELVQHLSELAAYRRKRSPDEELVTWAIEAYFDKKVG